MDFSMLSIDEFLNRHGFECTCGKHHKTALQHVEIGRGAIDRLAGLLETYKVRKPFVLCDKNTYKAAGMSVVELLRQAGISHGLYVYPQNNIEPDEFAVGQAVLAFEPDCDFIIAVGSGVINDISKILAKVSGRNYIVVGTAPSMDGYASNSSSMIYNGIKTTIYSACPVAIIADTEIMRNAPMIMLQAGLGDMVAKYVSICEWRISNIINGEYYCPQIAQLMRKAVEKCVQNAGKIRERDPEAIESVVEGLILSGIAMSFAEVSRPASGLEHYFSHMFDMFSLERGTPGSLHGIQVGIGTVLTLSIYDKLKKLQPDKESALASVEAFDTAEWENEMHRIFGKTAGSIIELEHQCGKNDKEKHRERIDKILDKWADLLYIMNSELPSSDDMKAVLESAGAPVMPSEIGIQDNEVYDALIGSKEIRDKYIASRLLWDLGLLRQYAEELVSDLGSW